jgi:lipopolysaccharide export system permease protein
MKKIDWYILKKLLVTFVFCMLLFTVIAVAVDSSEKTEDFVKANMSTGQIITQYYLGFCTVYLELIISAICFLLQ